MRANLTDKKAQMKSLTHLTMFSHLHKPCPLVAPGIVLELHEYVGVEAEHDDQRNHKNDLPTVESEVVGGNGWSFKAREDKNNVEKVIIICLVYCIPVTQNMIMMIGI